MKAKSSISSFTTLFLIFNCFIEIVVGDVLFTLEKCDRSSFGLQIVPGDPSKYRQCGPTGRIWIVPCAPGTSFDAGDKVCKTRSHHRPVSTELANTVDITSREISPPSPIVSATSSAADPEEFVFSTKKPKRPRMKTGRNRTTSRQPVTKTTTPKATRRTTTPRPKPSRTQKATTRSFRTTTPPPTVTQLRRLVTTTEKPYRPAFTPPGKTRFTQTTEVEAKTTSRPHVPWYSTMRATTTLPLVTHATQFNPWIEGKFTAATSAPTVRLPAQKTVMEFIGETLQQPEYTVKYKGQSMSEEEFLKQLLSIVKTQKLANEQLKKFEEEQKKELERMDFQRRELEKAERQRIAVLEAEERRRNEEQLKLERERLRYQKLEAQRKEQEKLDKEKEQERQAEIARIVEEREKIQAEAARVARERIEQQRLIEQAQMARQLEKQRREEIEAKQEAEKQRIEKELEKQRIEKQADIERQLEERRLAEKAAQVQRKLEEERLQMQNMINNERMQIEQKHTFNRFEGASTVEPFMEVEFPQMQLPERNNIVAPLPDQESGHIHFTTPPPPENSDWVTSSNSWQPPSNWESIDINEDREVSSTIAPTKVVAGCIVNGDCPFTYDQDLFCEHPDVPSMYLQCAPLLGRRGRWTERFCPDTLVFVSSLARCEKGYEPNPGEYPRPFGISDKTPRKNVQPSAYKPSQQIVIPRLPSEEGYVQWQGNGVVEYPVPTTPAPYVHTPSPPPRIYSTIDAFPPDLLPNMQGQPVYTTTTPAPPPTLIPVDYYGQQAQQGPEVDLSVIHPLFPRVQPAFLKALPSYPRRQYPAFQRDDETAPNKNSTKEEKQDDDLYGAIVKPVIKQIAMDQTEQFLDRLLADEKSTSNTTEADVLKVEGSQRSTTALPVVVHTIENKTQRVDSNHISGSIISN